MPSGRRHLPEGRTSPAPPGRDGIQATRDIADAGLPSKVLILAGRLHLSAGTVKIHVGRILAKLGLRDRVRAVVLAYESALITPGTQPPDAPRRFTGVRCPDRAGSRSR